MVKKLVNTPYAKRKNKGHHCVMAFVVLIISAEKTPVLAAPCKRL